MNFNPLELMKNFGNIQAKMKELHGKLAAVHVVGCAGGDMVKVELNGHFDVLSVYISAEVMRPDELDLLQSLVRAAMSDALHKVKEALKAELSSVTGGVIPPGILGF